MYILLILSILLLSSCEPDNPKVASFHKIVKRVHTRVTDQFPLIAEGSGGAMMYKVEIIALDYLSYQEMNVEQARNLFLKVVEIALEEINQDEIIRPFLVQYPFEAKNLHIALSFRDENYDSIEPPFVAFVYSKDGFIKYRENKDEFSFKPILNETHEEARQRNAEYESTLKKVMKCSLKSTTFGAPSVLTVANIEYSTGLHGVKKRR